MEIVKKMLVVDFIISILIMILMVNFPSIMFHGVTLCAGGILIFNWIYLKVKRDKIKEFYFNYYDDKELAKLVFKWSIFVSYCILFSGAYLIIEFAIGLQ